MASPLELLNSFKQRLNNATRQPTPSTTVGTGGSRALSSQASRYGLKPFYNTVVGSYTPKGNAQFPVGNGGLMDQITPQVRSDYKFDGNGEQRFKAEYSKNKPTSKTQPIKPTKPPAPPKSAKGLLKTGGSLARTGLYGIEAAESLNAVVRGDWRTVARNAAAGWLARAATNFKNPLIAGPSLVIADQRAAGGAIYDENGKYLPGMEKMMQLTPEQKALQKKLAEERGRPTATLSETPPKPLSEAPQKPLSEKRKSLGAGNAGGAQSQNPEESGYIPPTGLPLSVPQTPQTPEAPVDPGVRENNDGIVQKGKKLSSSDLSSLGILDATRFFNPSAPAGEGEVSVNIGGKTYELSGEDLTDFDEAVTEAPGMQGKYNDTRSKASTKSYKDVELTEEDMQYVSPMYSNAARNAARRAFLDAPADTGPRQLIARSNRAVGGDEVHGLNVGGQHRNWKEGLSQKERIKALYALRGGVGNTEESFNEFASQFLKDAEVNNEGGTKMYTTNNVVTIRDKEYPVMNEDDYNFDARFDY